MKVAESSTIRSRLADYGSQLPILGFAAREILRSGSSVLMFHRVLPDNAECYESEMATSKESFANLLDWLTENFRVMPLDELANRRGKLDRNRPACAITFDDGWVDNYLHAFPLLQARSLPATIFLPLAFIGTKRRFWQERLWHCLLDLRPDDHQGVLEKAARHFPWFPPTARALQPVGALKRFLMTRPTEEAEEFVQHLAESARLPEMFDRAFLNWDEVLNMRSSGISFGSHTLNHVLLTQMQPGCAESEIQKSRQELQERLGSEIASFSYPWGAASSFTREVVKRAGYTVGVGTHPRLVKDDADPRFLPRFAISDATLRSGKSFSSHKFMIWCARNSLFTKISAEAKRKPAEKSRPTKISFVIDQISEWEGGTERQLHALIAALDRRYFDPKLYFIFRDPGFSEETLPCAAEWICPDPLRIPPFPVRLWRLTCLLKKQSPDIIQTFFIEGNFAGILAGRLAGVPTIVGSVRNAGHWKKRRHRIAFRTVAPLAHLWQCNSRTLRTYTSKVERVPPDRIEILPNAVDLSRFTPQTRDQRLAERRKLQLNDHALIFVSVAALAPVKDLRTLLLAVSHVKEQLRSAQFLILGDGPLRKDLEQQSAQLGLTEIFRFAGRQPDVRPYLAAADFGVLTSLSEGSSNSVLEYMAMGLPSVVSDIEPNRELVNGLFFTPGDSADLAKNLLLICGDGTLRATLRAEYLASALQFSSEKFLTRAQSYYSKLAAGVR